MNDFLLSVPVTACQLGFIGGVFLWTRSACVQRLSFRIAMTIVICWGAVAVTAFALSLVGAFSRLPYYLMLLGVGVVFGGMRGSGVRSEVLATSATRRVSFARWGHRWFWIGVLSFCLSHVVLYAVMRLPCDWDSMAYHLPIVDHWIQYSRLTPRDCAFWYAPGNSELVTHFFVAGYSGDFWAGLTNLPAVGLLISATIELLILLRVRMLFRAVAIASLLASQIITRQLISQENDIAVASLYVAAVMFGWHWISRTHSIHAAFRSGAVSAIAIGLLSGIKYYALGYAIIGAVGISAFVLLIGGFRRFAQTVFMMTVAIFLCGSFWYLRNWFVTGSPLFPKGFPSLGMPDLWGEMRPGNELSSLRRGITVRRAWMLERALLYESGPSTLFAVVSLPVVIVVGLFSKLTRDTRLSRYMAASIAGAVLVYINTPNVIESVAGTENMISSYYHPVRFGSSMWTMATIGVFSLSANLRRRWLRMIAISVITLLTLGDVWLQFLHHFALHEFAAELGIRFHLPGRMPLEPFTLILLTLNISLSVMVLQTVQLQAKWRNIMILVASAVIVVVTGVQSAHWHEQYDDHFEQFEFQGALSEIRSVLTDRDRLFVCQYTYYLMLRSDRSGNVIRPLYFSDRESFEEQVRASGATKILANESDTHWTHSYDNVMKYIEQNPERYRVLRTWGELHLIEVLSR